MIGAFKELYNRFFLNLGEIIGLFTLVLQKWRMLQVQRIKGEAVVSYRKPLTTQEMRYPPLSRGANKSVILILSIDSTGAYIIWGSCSKA